MSPTAAPTRSLDVKGTLHDIGSLSVIELRAVTDLVSRRL